MAAKTVIAELLVEIGVDAKDAEKAADRISQKLKKVEKSAKGADGGVKGANKRLERFTKIGDAAGKVANGIGLALGGVAATVGFLAKEVLTVGGRFEALKVQLKTTTGSALGAEKAFKFIKDFAKNTPFQVEQVTEAFVKLNNFGIEPTSRTLTAFGDFASAMGKTLNDFIEAVTDATTGEFERLKEFGIKTSSEGDRVKFPFRGITTEVGKNAKEIQEFLTGISEQNFGGAMAEQMTTVGGLVSNLQDSFAEFMNAVAQMGPLDEFKLLIEDLRDAAGGKGGLAKMLAQTLTKAIRGIRSLLKGNLIPTLERMLSVMEFVITNFGKLSALFAAGKLISSVSALASTFGGLGISISALTGPIGIAVGALSILGIAAVKVTNQINAIPKVPKAPKLDATSRALAPVASGKIDAAQAELAALERNRALHPSTVTATSDAKLKGIKGRISRLQDEAIAEERSRSDAANEALISGITTKSGRISEVRSLLATFGETDELGFFNTDAQRDFDIASAAIEGGATVEEAISAVSEAEVSRQDELGALKGTGGRKRRPKKAKKKKKQITSPTTVSEFFGAAARGELGTIADRTPSTRDIEPTVAVDITNNNFNFRDTFNIAGATDPVEVGKQVIKVVKTEFDRRLSNAGQNLATNMAR